MDRKRPELDAVIFDVGNVLVTFRPEEGLFRLYDPETAQAIRRALFESGHWREVDRGVLPLDQVLRAVKAEFPAAAPFVEDVTYRHYPTWLWPLESSVAYLPRLKAAGYRLFVLSNFGASFFEQVRERFDFLSYMDGVVISGEEKLLKPDPALYRILLNRFGVNPARAVFFDDMPENVQAAWTLGMPAQVFHDPAQWDALLNPDLPGFSAGPMA